jgi:hypothetical protein
MASKSIHRVAADVIIKLNEQFVTKYNSWGLFSTTTPWRVWTRGDGVRYKEHSFISTFDSDTWLRGMAKDKEINFTFKKTKGAESPRKVVVDAAWEMLKSLPGAKDMGTVSGEFGSSPHFPAIKYKGTLFMKCSHTIDYASPSILRNTSIWRHHPPKTEK